MFLLIFFLLGHSSSVIPSTSRPLSQVFEFAISFPLIPLVTLSAGLKLVETYLHSEGSVRV